MASANLRYLAIRRRLAPLLVEDVPHGTLVEKIIGELYRSLSHYSAIAYFRVEDDGLSMVVGRGLGEGEVDDVLRAGLAGVVAREGRLLFVPDVARNPRARPVREMVVGELLVPVVHDGAAMGVIDVQSERPNGLGLGDRELLSWLAAQLTASDRAIEASP